MRIGYSGQVSENKAIKSKSKPKKSGNFKLDIEGGTSGVAKQAEVNGISNVDALIALQSVDKIDPNEQKRTAFLYSQDLLDNLEKLQKALLLGEASPLALKNLLSLIHNKPDIIIDPGLQAVMDQISLRVQVELAKRKLI